MKHRVAIALLMLGILAGLKAGAALAQGTATPDPAGALAPSTGTLLRGQVAELFSVYLPRGPQDIQRMLDNAREFQMSASAQITQARTLANEATHRARIMREEIATSKTKRGVAKKAKDKAAIEALDATIERQQGELAYLEDLRSAMDAEADRVVTEQAAMTARVKALQLETLLAKKNEELRSPLASSDAPGQYRIMLRNLLDAQRESADRFREAAEKDRKVVERRIAQLKSLSKLQP